MKKTRIAALVTGTIIFLCSAALILFPYLPAALYEGYPKRLWPAPGVFTQINKGVENAIVLPTGTIQNRSFDLMKSRGGEVLIVAHNGEVKLAHYEKSVSPTTKFNSYSMAKSIIGALILRAVADGKIANINQPIGVYFPNLGNEKLRQTPIYDFVHMQTSISVERPSALSPGDTKLKDMEIDRFNPFSPMVKFHTMGPDSIWSEIRVNPSNQKQFNYQNTNTAILGTLLEKLYQKPLEKLVTEFIWHPAGAGAAEWRRYNTDAPVTPYCCIYATPGDWLQIAKFLLANGTPQKQFLPIKEYQLFFGAHVTDRERHAGVYGYQNYHNILDRKGEKLQGHFTYFQGSKGQNVFFMPKENLIVIRFGNGLPLIHSTLYAAWDHIKEN